MTADDLGRAIPGTRPDTGAARCDESDARKSGQRRSAICHAHQHHFLWLIIHDYGANDFMDRDLCPKVLYVRRTEQGVGLLVATCTAISTCSKSGSELLKGWERVKRELRAMVTDMVSHALLNIRPFGPCDSSVELTPQVGGRQDGF